MCFITIGCFLIERALSLRYFLFLVSHIHKKKKGAGTKNICNCYKQNNLYCQNLYKFLVVSFSSRVLNSISVLEGEQS